MARTPQWLPPSIGHYNDFKDKGATVYELNSYMLARSCMLFEYDGLPETIPVECLERIIQTAGHGIITDVNGKLYALGGGFSGPPDAYYRPTQYTVANPGLDYTATLTLGRDCVLMRNDTQEMGLLPIFSRYNSLLADNLISLRLSNINTRVVAILNASTDSQYKSAREFLANIDRGEMGVILNKTLAGVDGVTATPYNDGGRAGIIQQQIEFFNFVESELYSELGLSQNTAQSREYISDTEQNNEGLSYIPFIDNMLMCREAFTDAINAKYGTAVKVRKASAWAIADAIIKAEANTDPGPDQMEKEGATDEND